MKRFWLAAAAGASMLTACSGNSSESSPSGRSPQPAPTHAAAPVVVTVPVAVSTKPSAAIDRQPLVLAQLPTALRPSGKLLEAWRWTDTNGENVLIASRTVVTDEDQVGDGRAAHLLVRQYVRHGSSYQQLWQLQDAVTDCPLDLTLGLLPGSTQVSDLNGNGLTETTLVYAQACRGGVDAAGLKLIMHEGSTKYALRGVAIEMVGGPGDMAQAKRKAAGPTCCLDTLPAHSADYRQPEGLYANEKGFASAPPAFLRFARQQWRTYRTRADSGAEQL